MSNDLNKKHSETQNPAPERFVLCMKWGKKYGPEYVNRLYNMVRRHLTGHFRFVCLTDDTQGLDPQVETFPIPSMDLPSGIPERGWKKLTTFAADLYGLRGRALFLDIDIVIVGSMDEFFDYPGEFLIIHDYKRPWRITGNSSVYRFELGAHPDVLDYFREHPEQVRTSYRNEQAFLSAHLHQQGKLAYWPKAWCPSFKYHCIPMWPTNYWREAIIPSESKVIIFHGEVNPPDAAAGRRNRAWRFIKPVSWVNQYWR